MKSPERYSAVTDAIRAQKAKAILEVGTWNGDRAIAMAGAALEGGGKVLYVGFDLFERMTADKAKAELNVKTPSPEVAVKGKLDAFKAKHGDFSFMLYRGDTRQTLPQFVNAFGPGAIDLVWLDGGHSVETVASDWAHCRKVVRPGGVILLDDFYSSMEPAFLKKFGCNVLVTRLIEEKAKVTILPTKDPVIGGGLVQIVRVDL